MNIPLAILFYQLSTRNFEEPDWLLFIFPFPLIPHGKTDIATSFPSDSNKTDSKITQ